MNYQKKKKVKFQNIKKMIKPNLKIYFSQMNLIGLWLNSDYEKANTKEDLTNLMHKWFNVAEETTNKTKKNFYELSAKKIYSILTKKTYESNNRMFEW